MLDDDVAHGSGQTAFALMDGDDGAVLGVHGLDLQPGVGAFALRIGSVGILDHGALEALRDETTEGVVRGQVHERLDELDGTADDIVELGHQGTALAVGADIVGQVEEPEERTLGRVIGADSADGVVEVLPGHGLAVEGEHAVLAGGLGEPLAKVGKGVKRVAVAGLHRHGQRLAADFHDHADAVNLRLDRIGLRQDALVRLGQHGLRKRRLGRLARTDAEARVGLDHAKDEIIQFGVRVGHVVRDSQGMPGPPRSVKGERKPA